MAVLPLKSSQAADLWLTLVAFMSFAHSSDSHAGVGWEQEQIGHGIAKRTVKAFICERLCCLRRCLALNACTSAYRPTAADLGR